jgi:hypothetical protein
MGAEEIYREGQQRYIAVKYSVRGRDLGPVFQYRNQFLNHHHMAGLCGRKHHELFQPDGGSLHAKFPCRGWQWALPLYEALCGNPAQLSEISGVDLTRSLLWILLPGALLGSVAGRAYETPVNF